jgi:hypothetical protein
LAEYIDSEPERNAAKAEAQKAKLEALEKKLGIDGQASGSKDGQPAVLAGTKHRFDDTEYLEQSRELVEGVKSAVSVGKLSSIYSYDHHLTSSQQCLRRRRKPNYLTTPH